ncbi:nuclear transport factor 2 family protein [Bacteroidota bacterium]
MNKFLKLIIILTFFTSCCETNVRNERTNEIKTKLNVMIDQWHQDAANAKLDAYIGTMADSGVFIGTDASERWAKSEFYAFCKPHFDKGKTWEFHPLQRFVYISEDGSTAWFDELLDTKLGLCRGSGVIQKKDGQWKIEQYVLSPTIPNDMINKVVTEKRVADSVTIEMLSAQKR